MSATATKSAPTQAGTGATPAQAAGSIMPTYPPSELCFTRGEGAYLFTEDGRRYLDFGAGIAVNSLGHAHPRLVAALCEQAGKLWHCSNLYRIPDQEKLARLITESCFAEQVFFCNSGLEALEGAIKIARKYQSAVGSPEKWRVVTMTGAFHGRSLATIAAGGNARHLDGFGPQVDGFDQIAHGNLNELRDAITPATAAILVEPIQGEGGILSASHDYLRGIRQAADEFGLMLIYDEVQCGIGRTGRMFAHQWVGDGEAAAPDIMALAKGLGGGFPVGAIATSRRAALGMVAGTHGSTFGGNPLAMAVATAVYEEITRPGFLDRVCEIAQRLRAGLVDIVHTHATIFSEVRGTGLMLGLKSVIPNGEVVAMLASHQLLTIPAADNVVRLLPPLIINEGEVDAALAAIRAACLSPAWQGKEESA